ncbi:AMP-binding protein [Bradyrhizobium sp. HKCCYLS20291]|uniref:AMP-binding protein n=1 Tax=Bradyrhizobium sp. HKCCYLS20291 TaxID=3420766 RepID=UPI003EBF8C26
MHSRRPQIFVDILRGHAVAHTKSPAITFLGDDGDEQTWSYGELDARARAMAAALLDVTQSGQRALLLCPQGLEFVAAILGCFYAGVVAVPAYPPANARHWPRLARILADSQASVVVSTSGAKARTEAWLEGMRRDGAAAGALLICEDVDLQLADRFVGPELSPENYAFLQYTSGSTMSPKGVVVTHANLLANLIMIRDSFGLTSRSDTVSWLPVFHDMGLIASLLEQLFLGARAVLMAAPTFIRRPATWLEAITRFRPDWVGAPNFGYARCVEGVSEEQRRGLDLSSVRVAYCGSEPVDSRVADAFAAAFASSGFDPKSFHPCYGMAEVTLFAAGSEPGSGGRRIHLDGAALERRQAKRVDAATPGAKVLFSCGRPPRGETLRIVDPDSCRPLPDGDIGEIWLAGPHVALGYWRNPEQTRASFGAKLAGEGDGESYLRTGDLGFVEAGEVCVTGRIKDLLIIRGLNHYPQDIERTVAAAHPSLQPADSGAAFAISRDGTEQAVVVHEVRRTALRQLDAGEVVGAIREAVAQEHGLALAAVVLLQPPTLPRTSSGKVQRRECARAFAAGELAEAYRWEAPALRVGQSGSEAASGAREKSERPGSAERADRVIGWLRDYAETRIDSRLIDERRAMSPHIVLDFGRMGLLGMRASQEIGGLALSYRDMLRVLQQIAAIDTTIAAFVAAHNVLGVQPVLRHGTEAQRRLLLPDLAQGRQLGSFAFTEPAAGSNSAAIAATAVENDDGTFTLNGSKRWIGTAAWAGTIHVFARVIDRAGVNRGVTAFTLAQHTPGLVQGPEELTVGLRGMVQNCVELRDVRATAADVLGEIGRGMQIAQGILQLGRACTAAVSAGVLKRSAQLMVRYAGRRQIASGRLLDNIMSRDRLTALLVEVIALEQFVDALAGWLDAGPDVPAEIYAAIKALSAEAAYRGVDSLVQMLGGRGYIETNLAPQMLRDVRLLRIFEGPTETMQMFVGSRVAAGSAPLRSFLRDHLKARQLGEALDDAARRLVQTNVDVQRRVALLAELGCWTVWCAVLDVAKDVGAAASDPLAARARDWTGQRLALAAKAIDDAMAGATPEALEVTEIEAAVARFAGDIGDHEQHRPGVVDQIDPLLRREDRPVEITSTQPSALAHAPSVKVMPLQGVLGAALQTRAMVSAPGAPDQLGIERWLQQWIARRAQLDIASVDRRRTFADFGLDSVTSVELASDLAQFVKAEVSQTAAWDYPNIETLARATAESLVARAGSDVPARAPSDRRSMAMPTRARVAAVDLDGLSEKELAALLSAEIDGRDRRP